MAVFNETFWLLDEDILVMVSHAFLLSEVMLVHNVHNIQGVAPHIICCCFTSSKVNRSVIDVKCLKLFIMFCGPFTRNTVVGPKEVHNFSQLLLQSSLSGLSNIRMNRNNARPDDPGLVALKDEANATCLISSG